MKQHKFTPTIVSKKELLDRALASKTPREVRRAVKNYGGLMKQHAVSGNMTLERPTPGTTSALEFEVEP